VGGEASAKIGVTDALIYMYLARVFYFKICMLAGAAAHNSLASKASTYQVYCSSTAWPLYACFDWQATKRLAHAAVLNVSGIQAIGLTGDMLTVLFCGYLGSNLC
jgi:hypothetical protein